MYTKKVNTHKADNNEAKQEVRMNNTTTSDGIQIKLWLTKHGYMRRKKNQ